MADKLLSKQEKDSIESIGIINTLLRNAIEKAIPCSPDQYLTVAVPGTVIDLNHYDYGGSYVYDAAAYVDAPMRVQLAEAKLVDGMCPLSNIMVGATGKSVARSYARALDALVPFKASIHSLVGQDANEAEDDPLKILSPGSKLYDNAMAYLITPNQRFGNRTPLEIYTEKQRAWAEAANAWDEAKARAMADSMSKYPTEIGKAKEDYQIWNQTHFRFYKSAVQAAYMSFVALGDKYNVEANFGLVDVDSIMARIEDSKESMRNDIIVDANGADEVWRVELTPANWATLCKLKALAWFNKNGTYSLDQLDTEISRLDALYVSLSAMKVKVGGGDFPLLPPNPTPTEKEGGKDVTDTKTALENAVLSFYGYKKGDDMTKERKDLAAALENRAKYLRYQTATEMNAANKDSTSNLELWLEAKLHTIDEELTRLKGLRGKKLAAENYNLSIPVGASNAPDPSQPTPDAATTTEKPPQASGISLMQQGDENVDALFAGDPAAGAAGAAVVEPDGTTDGANPNVPAVQRDPAREPIPTSDPWTTVKCVISSQDMTKTNTQSAWGMSVGGGVGWGLWSAGGSYSHDQARSDMMQDMAACDISVTFSALVVNVHRAWLYPELFADTQLDVARGFLLSLGAQELQRLMHQQGTETDEGRRAIRTLAKYNEFPAYPSSFLIAADTEISFSGDTTHIDNHFRSSTDSGGVSVGWGPWSVSSNFHHSSASQSFRFASTSTGCKLSFGAPQIIGWVNEILPALPRPPDFESMVQGLIPS
ncbi:hypothetical protein B0H67DRAFT_638077 [Lasiosphaeris hirsuta]|uniref:Uncharacterized protein n=1 Tax=Lasiosphaeris hirsuta TaxID=260670 RepID=A0AA40B8D4_9PEZI|nr:hypothetical protein B0H67DRAFT_638077 [Lasiosphaeris hirsuta]